MEWLTREWIEECLRRDKYDDDDITYWGEPWDCTYEWFRSAVAHAALEAAERRYDEAWGDRLRVSGDLKSWIEWEVFDTVSKFLYKVDFHRYAQEEPTFSGIINLAHDILTNCDFWNRLDWAVAEALREWAFRSTGPRGNKQRELVD